MRQQQLGLFLQSCTLMRSCLWPLRQCPGAAPEALSPLQCSPGPLGPLPSCSQQQGQLLLGAQGALQAPALASRLLLLLQWPGGLWLLGGLLGGLLLQLVQLAQLQPSSLLGLLSCVRLLAPAVLAPHLRSLAAAGGPPRAAQQASASL